MCQRYREAGYLRRFLQIKKKKLNLFALGYSIVRAAPPVAQPVYNLYNPARPSGQSCFDQLVANFQDPGRNNANSTAGTFAFFVDK